MDLKGDTSEELQTEEEEEKETEAVESKITDEQQPEDDKAAIRCTCKSKRPKEQLLGEVKEVPTLLEPKAAIRCTCKSKRPKEQPLSAELKEVPTAPETGETESPDDQQLPAEEEKVPTTPETPGPCFWCLSETPDEQHPSAEDEQAATTQKASLLTVSAVQSISSTTVQNFISNIQEKCQIKDKMISALANELQLHASSHVWKNLLDDLANVDSSTEPPCDFDQEELCRYLRKPSDSSVDSEKESGAEESKLEASESEEAEAVESKTSDEQQPEDDKAPTVPKAAIRCTCKSKRPKEQQLSAEVKEFPTESKAAIRCICKSKRPKEQQLSAEVKEVPTVPESKAAIRCICKSKRPKEQQLSAEVKEVPTVPDPKAAIRCICKPKRPKEQQLSAEVKEFPTEPKAAIRCTCKSKRPKEQQLSAEVKEVPIASEAGETEAPDEQQPEDDKAPTAPKAAVRCTCKSKRPKEQPLSAELKEVPTAPEAGETEVPDEQQLPAEEEQEPITPETPGPCFWCLPETPDEQHPSAEDEQAATAQKASLTVSAVQSISSTTVQSFITNIQEKCQTKDKMISALANELQLHASSHVWKNLLNDLANVDSSTEPPCDFDQEELCRILRKPSDVAAEWAASPSRKLLPRGACKKKCRESCTCGPRVVKSLQRLLSAPLASKLQTESTTTFTVEVKPRYKHKDTSSLQEQSVDLQEPSAAQNEQYVSDLAKKPLGLHVVRQLEPDSLLLGWNAPPQSSLSGFEIYINGVFVHKVHSPSRNKALIRNVNLSSKMVISLYALTPTGRLSEPVCAVYPDRVVENKDMEASPSPSLPSS